MPPRRELTREEKDEKNMKAMGKKETTKTQRQRKGDWRRRREGKRRRLDPDENQAAKNLNV